MADINLKQVVHNVKEALIEKGVTDTITYGNINQIVLDLSGEGKKVINIEAIDANTVEVTYEDDSTATIVLEYDDDGKIIKLNGANAVYDGDNLVRFGSADIDIEEIPAVLVNTGFPVTFIGDVITLKKHSEVHTI